MREITSAISSESEMRLVDGLPQLLHHAFQFSVHVAPELASAGLATQPRGRSHLFRCLKYEGSFAFYTTYLFAGTLPPTARIRITQNPVQSEKNPATTRDFGTRSRALLRVTGRRTGENRWVRAFYRAGDVTVRHTGRVARVLWLEVTGFLFLCLAVVGAAAAFSRVSPLCSGRSRIWQSGRRRSLRPDVCVLRHEFVLEIAKTVRKIAEVV